MSAYTKRLGDEYPLTFGRIAHPMNGRSDAMADELEHENFENQEFPDLQWASWRLGDDQTISVLTPSPPDSTAFRSQRRTEEKKKFLEVFEATNSPIVHTTYPTALRGPSQLRHGHRRNGR